MAVLSAIPNLKDYILEVVRGNVLGAEPEHKGGYITGISNTERVVWNGPLLTTFVFPPDAGEAMEVISSSVNDDGNPTGSGAWTVSIGYLDENFLPQSATVTLDGTTAVSIAAGALISRVNTLRVVTGNAAAGNIDVRSVATPANIFRRISAGRYRSTSSVFTVPEGKAFYMVSWTVSGSDATAGHYAHFRLYSNGDGDVLRAVREEQMAMLVQDGTAYKNGMPHRFPPKSDIYVTVVSDTGSASVTALSEVEGWIENGG